MRRAALGALAILVLLSCTVWAHDVPDNVKITIFLKPDGDRMLFLVRIPANALIDVLFPTRPNSDWLDMSQIDPFAAEGAKVWVADLLSVSEDGRRLPTPEVLAARISRANDASFSTFQKAMDSMNGRRLPSDTLLTQDQAVVDTLLEAPIHSGVSSFSFEPNFARVGVRVTTTLAFLPARGGIRQFEYEGDPAAFPLDPSWSQAAAGLFRDGFERLWAVSDYVLFFLCVALVFQRFRTLAAFTAAFTAAQLFVMIGSGLGLMPSAQWIPPLWGVLIAAAIAYMAMEAIAAGPTDDRRPGLAVATGLIFGAGFWFELDPLLQFGGAHRFASVFAFDCGIVAAYVSALALPTIAVKGLMHFSSAPRIAVIIVAAVAIRISWHRMLDRAQAFSLVPVTFAVTNVATLILAGMAVAAALAAGAYRWRRAPSAAR
jgi:hypothetical protein